METELYFEVLKTFLRLDSQLPEACKAIDWKDFFQFCFRQSIIGVGFDGIKRHEKELKGHIDKELLLKWFAYAEKIAEQNRKVNRRTLELTQLLEKNGFKSCILKGQGNTLMYPNPCARMPGDIDAWVDADRKQIEDYVKSQFSEMENSEQDIKFPIFPDVVVELHYKPQLMVRTKYKKRLFEYFDAHKEQQFTHYVFLPECESKISIPTTEFNVIFQMSHIMAHFYKEGIGLRQFIDYYYVLKNSSCNADIEKEFKYLGMLKFVRGVMWVQKEYLGLDENYLLVEPDKKAGRVILNEMVNGGNFGKFDERYSARKYGYLVRGITDIYRLMRLSSYFPEDSFAMIWRKFESQKWKLKSY